MPDPNTVWTVLHDVGLATVGALIGGRYALGVAKLQTSDLRAKEKADRRRELVKEIGVRFGEILFDVKAVEERLIARAHEFVEARKKGEDPPWIEPRGTDEVVATLKKVNDLYMLAQIDGHGGIARELVNYLEAVKGIALVGTKMLRASHSGTIPEEMLTELASAQTAREKVLNQLYIYIRDAYNAE